MLRRSSACRRRATKHYVTARLHSCRRSPAGFIFFWGAFIQPTDAFDLTLSTEAIVICMLGGQGTVTGVALGAYLYEELRGYLLTSSTFSNFQLVIAGALLLMIVSFFPSGLMGFIYSRFPRMQKILE
jgi:branched-chain amino acid transport system permease protein